jgi:hemoglobin-like flavoprotein
MDITDRQKAAIRLSFISVAEKPTSLAAMFYARLFELDPSLRPLFKSDLVEQGQKFMQILAVMVRSLDDLESLTAAIEALGRRHLKYGVKMEHYETVGNALIWTLEKQLGGQFTPEVRDAWEAIYACLASVATAQTYAGFLLL